VTTNSAQSGSRLPAGPVRDAAGHIYKFGTLRLGAGKQAIIHTGKGTSYATSAGTHLHWGRSWYVLEQHRRQGDPATRGRLPEDTCSYPGEGASRYYKTRSRTALTQDLVISVELLSAAIQAVQLIVSTNQTPSGWVAPLDASLAALRRMRRHLRYTITYC
jgi:hypothetical protein